MDLKLTKKQVMNSRKKVVSIGYCSLWHLLSCTERTGFTAGVYGWNADIYEFDDVIIVTGYRPFGEGVDGKLVTMIENKAREICTEYRFDNDNIREQKLNKLLNEFLKKVVE